MKPSIIDKYDREYELVLADAIIFSAKHYGLWTPKMSKEVRQGKMTKVYVDIPSLETALIAWRNKFCLEVIGEDERIPPYSKNEDASIADTEKAIRNEFRTEIRAKLKEEQ